MVSPTVEQPGLLHGTSSGHGEPPPYIWRVIREVIPVEFEDYSYDVISRSTGDYHRVDLEAYRWNGSCSCQHFIRNFSWRLEAGELPSDRTRCWHITRAIFYHHDEMMPKIARRLRELEELLAKQGKPIETARTAIRQITRLGDLMALRSILDRKLSATSNPNP